jgi:hypothetical protein
MIDALEGIGFMAVFIVCTLGVLAAIIGGLRLIEWLLDR